MIEEVHVSGKGLGQFRNARASAAASGKWSCKCFFDVDVHQRMILETTNWPAMSEGAGSPHVAQVLMPSASRRWNTQKGIPR
ncbi:MAG: hypothetical protein U1E74_03375 [Paenacidovorax caeni]